MIVTATAVVVIGAAVGLGLAWADAVARRALPAMPALTGANADTRSLVATAFDAARASPRDSAALGHLATVLHANQEYGAADRVYRQLRRREPLRFRWAYLDAVLDDERQSWDAARRSYERAVRLDPDHAEAWARLAELRFRMGRTAEAKIAARRAQGLDPAHPIAAVAFARVAALERRWSDIEGILAPVLAAHPMDSEAHKLLGRAMRRLGKPEQAIAHENLGRFGSAVDGPLVTEVYMMGVPAILNGDATRGAALIGSRCVRCHTLERTYYRPGKDRAWWAWTVRRMQRLAGRSLVTDDEAADLVAYLASLRE